MKTVQSYLVKVSVLSFAALAIISAGCTKNESKPNSEIKTDQPKDRTHEILSKVAGQRLNLNTSSISFGANGDFELLLKTYVRYFPKEGRDSFAMCFMKIWGKASFVEDPARQFSSDKTITTTMTLAGVLPLNSGHNISYDQPPVAPTQICEEYATAVREKKIFEQWLFDFDSNYLGFIGFDFDIYDQSAKKWQFEGKPSSAHRNSSGFSRNNFDYAYFVKPDSSVDFTSSFLRDLEGTLIEMNGPNKTELNVISKLKTIHLKNEECGLSYMLDIQDVKYDGQQILASIKPSTLDFPTRATGNNRQGCSDIEDNLKSLLKYPVQVEYEARVSDQNKKENRLKLKFEVIGYKGVWEFMSK